MYNINIGKIIMTTHIVYFMIEHYYLDHEIYGGITGNNGKVNFWLKSLHGPK